MMYKTVSFPRQESGTGKIERLRIVFNFDDSDLQSWLVQLRSKEIRDILGSTYSELALAANETNTPISQIAIETLKTEFFHKQQKLTSSSKTGTQLGLFVDSNQPLGKHGTFSPNHVESIHRWYPYIEGFSSTFVSNLISKWGPNARSVYDPFGGTGTTLTVAAMMGIEGYYSEVNPFMQHVIEGKTNVLRNLANQTEDLAVYFSSICDDARSNPLTEEQSQREFSEAFADRPYFSERRLVEILSLKNAILNGPSKNPDFQHLALLALGSIAVYCSDLKRAADLRYRHPREFLPSDFSVFDYFEQKLEMILDDIDVSLGSMQNVQCIGDDALGEFKRGEKIDLIVTSPPYLNGTNYFRNTKIELWLTGFIKSEKDLGYFTRRAVTAGINNVSKNGREFKEYDFVEPIAKQLDEVAYDRRIPELVRRYCTDAETWLRNCYKLLVSGGRAVVDIGDSRFAGVHVPTDLFLQEIALLVGFEIECVEIVRRRTSKDGTPLKQVLLILRKPDKKTQLAEHIEQKGQMTEAKVRSIVKSTPLGLKQKLKWLENSAKDFENTLPHQKIPFSSRNWGNPLHSLCSYQGKLKPAIAHFLVKEFTNPGEVVLDPMSGAGTIPLEAMLNGRRAYANDLQELGYLLSSAKIGRPVKSKVDQELQQLIEFVKNNEVDESVEEFSDFGFNGKLDEYFENKTFKEILSARRYMGQNPCSTVERAVVYSCLLHILHGNRPYALSRRSHPVTPLKPTGDYEYRNLADRLTDKVSRAFNGYGEEAKLEGVSTFGCFEDLGYTHSIDAVITSPPFAASTKFYIANWLRLWMSGWNPEDFSGKKEKFIEYRQKTSFEVYGSFFDKCNQWLKPNGIIIMHLGKTKKFDMAKELIQHSKAHFEVAYHFDEDVIGHEKFGLKDQGATKAHQYLFLVKRQ